MDFDIPISPKIVAVPRGLSWRSRSDASQGSGSVWTNTLGFVAVGATHEKNLFFDGVNEAGLSAALLWLNETQYMPRQGNEGVSTFDLVAYILGQYRSVAEAKVALSHLKVYGTYLPEYDIVLPLHLMVTDANGDSLIVEWVNGRIDLYDKNTPGFIVVMANSPPYDEQLRNLAAYEQLSCNNGQEYSLTGLPGNSFSSSRFVRAAKLKQCAENLGGDASKPYLLATEGEAVQRAAVILGRLDKVEGETVLESDTSTTLSSTRLSLIRVHGKIDRLGRPTSKLYFYSPDNRALRIIDLAKLDFRRSARRDLTSFYVESSRYKDAQQAIPIPRSR